MEDLVEGLKLKWEFNNKGYVCLGVNTRQPE